jgi:hypothetical protein
MHLTDNIWVVVIETIILMVLISIILIKFVSNVNK